jgi:hypothetical protein
MNSKVQVLLVVALAVLCTIVIANAGAAGASTFTSSPPVGPYDGYWILDNAKSDNHMCFRVQGGEVTDLRFETPYRCPIGGVSRWAHGIYWTHLPMSASGFTYNDGMTARGSPVRFSQWPALITVKFTSGSAATGTTSAYMATFSGMGTSSETCTYTARWTATKHVSSAPECGWVTSGSSRSDTPLN